MNIDKLEDIEREFALRLAGLAEQAASRGVPVDLVVRALLGAGLAFARRFDSGASIAAQLQPVLDALAEDDHGGDAPVLQ